MDFLKLSKLEILTHIERLIEEYEVVKDGNPELRSLLVKLQKLIIYGDPNDKTFGRNIARTRDRDRDFDSSASEDSRDYRYRSDTQQSINYPSSVALVAPGGSLDPARNSRYSDSDENALSGLVRLDQRLNNYDNRANEITETVTSGSISHLFGHEFTPSSGSAYRSLPNTIPLQPSLAFITIPSTNNRNDINFERRSNLERNWELSNHMEPPRDNEFEYSSHLNSNYGYNNTNNLRGNEYNHDDVIPMSQLCRRCYTPGHYVKDCTVSKEMGLLMKKEYYLTHPEKKPSKSKIEAAKREKLNGMASTTHNQQMNYQRSDLQETVYPQQPQRGVPGPSSSEFEVERVSRYRPEYEEYLLTTNNSGHVGTGNDGKYRGSGDIRQNQSHAPITSASVSGGPFCVNCRSNGHVKKECPLPKSYGSLLKKQFVREHGIQRKNRKRGGRNAKK